jgi:hypothetical protein
MGVKTLKKLRFGDSFKAYLSEEDTLIGSNEPNKLQSDVKRLSKMIKDKFSIALSKLDKPVEQVQFLQAMAAEIGVPLNKLNTLMSSFKDIAKDNQATPSLNESTKKPKVIKTIKVKDIK